MPVPPLSPLRARDLIARFDGIAVLVVGDVMLDRFIVGQVSRISPEAPVPVVRYRSEYVRLGGAANVAHNLAALGARVALIGTVGADAAADRLREQLASVGISPDGLVEDKRRSTVEKVRVVTERNQQVARIDYEDDGDAEASTEREIIDKISALCATSRAMLVSDYLKGSVTRAVLGELLSKQSAEATPLIVDPKIPHVDWYAGAAVVTPNHHEAEAATRLRIRSDADAREAAVAMRAATRAKAALITRGEHGMWLSSEEAEGAIRASAREVADVTGAGDTVVALVGLALAAGASLAESALIANQAAGIVVGKFGPATVTREELLAAF
jgi:D-beta-D-heptose 7-phosphate kinase/D-beta-D-heptose 1-phosphate adenosyltransferase